MSQETINQLEFLIKSQFSIMNELAEEIRKLNKSGRKEEAAKLANILDRLSADSLKIGTTIRDRAAA